MGERVAGLMLKEGFKKQKNVIEAAMTQPF